jgi:hypothetical protein
MRAHQGVRMQIEPGGEENLMFFLWIIGIVLWLVFIALTARIAASKGHSPVLWGILAVFFPIITVVIVLLLPSKYAVG